jgi:hypothetical protein
MWRMAKFSGVEVLAYVLTANHFHVLVKVPERARFLRRHERRGTPWMERFKSVLVEDGEALRTMALYIDLNPVRAGLVADPKDDFWTGYGEAAGGLKSAVPVTGSAAGTGPVGGAVAAEARPGRSGASRRSGWRR